MCSHRTSHVYHFYIMNTLIFLCAFICWTNFVNGFVSTVRRSNEEEEENEQRIVVKKLANMIRQNSEKLIDESSQNEDVEYDESIDTLPNDENLPTKHSIRISNEDYKHRKNEPFAVPPTDPRYYQKSFSMEVKPLETPSALTRGTSSVTISDKSKPLNETEEEIQRRKLYAHLTLYPSFIPYGQVKSIRIPPPGYYYNDKNATNFLALTYGTVCALLVICTGATYIFFRKFRKTVKDAEDVDYPAYGVTGPSKETPAPTGDRHLAHSAQMYHYQHQKQQIVAMEKNSSPTKGRKGTESGSEEDDMTVYECPGLAPVTGEMEVNNPMFQDEDEVKIPNTSGKEQNQNKKTHLEVKKSQKK